MPVAAAHSRRSPCRDRLAFPLLPDTERQLTGEGCQEGSLREGSSEEVCNPRTLRLQHVLMSVLVRRAATPNSGGAIRSCRTSTPSASRSTSHFADPQREAERSLCQNLFTPCLDSLAGCFQRRIRSKTIGEVQAAGSVPAIQSVQDLGVSPVYSIGRLSTFRQQLFTWLCSESAAVQRHCTGDRRKRRRIDQVRVQY